MIITKAGRLVAIPRDHGLVPSRTKWSCSNPSETAELLRSVAFYKIVIVIAHFRKTIFLRKLCVCSSGAAMRLWVLERVAESFDKFSLDSLWYRFVVFYLFIYIFFLKNLS